MSNNINAVQRNAASFQTTNQQPLMQRQNTMPLDRITFGKEESGCCGSILGGIKSIFSCIFSPVISLFKMIFCCCKGEKTTEGKLSSNQLQELKSAFSSLKDEFITKRKNLGEFKKWWPETFDSLNEKGQELLILKDMEGWAKNKLKDQEPPATPDAIKQHAKATYKDTDKINLSKKFVRDLNVDNAAVVPTDDEFLPAYFDAIIADLTSELENQEA